MCHLLYLLYSLKQTALDWYELLSSVLQILTSMDHQHLLSHDGKTFPDVKNLEHVYHNIIGYFSTSSQPNIAFAVQCLTQPCAQPEAHHFAAAKWVVCYLWGMQTLYIPWETLKLFSPFMLLAISTQLLIHLIVYLLHAMFGSFMEVPLCIHPRSRLPIHFPLQRPNTWLSLLVCRKSYGSNPFFGLYII